MSPIFARQSAASPKTSVDKIVTIFDNCMKLFCKSSLKNENLLISNGKNDIQLLPFSADDKIILRQMALFKEFQDIKINPIHTLSPSDQQENIPPNTVRDRDHLFITDLSASKVISRRRDSSIDKILAASTDDLLLEIESIMSKKTFSSKKRRSITPSRLPRAM